MTAPHRFSFVRAGGVDQVVFRSGDDLARLAELDQKLWAALACPTRGLEFDARTLDLIDTDHDGRIRAPELIAAVQWSCARLADPGVLLQGGDRLALEAIASNDDESRALGSEARQVLQLLGRNGDATHIALADVADRTRLLDALRFDGDGIVTPDATDDAPLQDALREAMRTQGAQEDRRKRPGLDRKHAEAFLAQADAARAWHHAAEGARAIELLGPGAPQALASVARLRPKIDDYFARARLADFDPRHAALLDPSEATMLALSPQVLDAASTALAALPLAGVQHGSTLPLTTGVNPYWAEALGHLRSGVLQPLLGEAPLVLTEPVWRQVLGQLGPALAWFAQRPAGALAEMPADRVAGFAALRTPLLALFDEEEAAGRQHGRIADLEKLLRLQRDLLKLLENFVSFGAFYRREGAIFQAGTLYLDARSCELTVRVEDPARHAALAGLAKAYLAYCECKRQGQRMFIVAAFTAGDVDFLFVGRNGIFYDRDGHDWDATITKIIENPTSVGQAFFSPYKKFLRVLEEQVAKRAAASDARAQSGLTTLAGKVATAAPANRVAGTPAPVATATAAPLPGLPRRFDVGTVAALGVALGSLSAVAVGVFAKFVDLGFWIPLALLCIMLAISGPSMLIAWLKLRQRSLGPILDASGWAVNGRMRINVRLGASLSRTARIPPGAHRQLHDPYAESHGLAWTLGVLVAALAVVLVLWRFGAFNPLLPAAMQVPAPAAAPVPPASAASR